MGYITLDSGNGFIEYEYDPNGSLINKKSFGPNAVKNLWRLFDVHGNFETDQQVADHWVIRGNVRASLDTDARYGTRSQRLETVNSWGALTRKIGHFVALIDYKTNASSTVSMRVNDQGTNWGLNLGYQYFVRDNTWRTAYIKFRSTGNPITIVGAFIDTGTDEVKVDGFRLFEITRDTFSRIDAEPEFSGTQLINKFPYGDLWDGEGSFEANSDHWLVKGNVVMSLDTNARYGQKSQRIQTLNSWGSLTRDIGSPQEGKHFVVFIDYMTNAASNVSISRRSGRVEEAHEIDDPAGTATSMPSTAHSNRIAVREEVVHSDLDAGSYARVAVRDDHVIVPNTAAIAIAFSRRSCLRQKRRFLTRALSNCGPALRRERPPLSRLRHSGDETLQTAATHGSSFCNRDNENETRGSETLLSACRAIA